MSLPNSTIHTPQSAIVGLLLALLLAGNTAAQDNPFAAGVRTTPWLTPADEQKLFKLPPGFEISLVAAEPQIQKPLNMAFDERGRIWLTNTVEYPYAAPQDRPGKDTIKVLEDTDGDGRFEKVTTFADGLNIPIGIYPWKGGCIAFSIPNIWHLEDTDGDGACDKRTILYGPFDTSRDTHGMCNAFRRGWDGWVYACHGFNNDSRVNGKDGHEVHLQSGNTFRFKLDGSRIEHFTHGQVNPFGMCFDELFNIFTADCHSKPIYQLLRGGYYPSFGKAHDGLGFVPAMMDHLHGSTAICGLVCYSGENFPAEYRGNFLSGNVMTSRINHNRPQYHGSTIKAIEQPDFLEAGDPWFRPVDLQIGPDGALYILDFYNRIIGHYEVPLTHPGRDRTSGRIWRVAYRAEGTGNRKQGTDLTKLTIPQFVEQMDSPQMEHRLRVTNYLADVKGKDCLAEVQQVLKAPRSPNQQIGAIWILERLESLPEGQRLSMISSKDRSVRVQALKLANERWAWRPADQVAATAALADDDAFVARAAAEALTRHDIADLKPLFESWDKTPAADSHRVLMLRMALRNNFAYQHLPGLTESRYRQLAEIVETIPNERAARFLYHHLTQFNESDDKVVRYVERIAQFPSNLPTENIVPWARKRSLGNHELGVRLLVALSKTYSDPIRRETASWADEVTGALLKADPQGSVSWTAVPLDGLPPSESPWTVQPRVIGSEAMPTLFYSSFPLAETRTGIYRSSSFAIPQKLSFWCAGHSGLLNKPITDKNWVRLRDAKTGEVLVETQPPRSDQGKLIEWDLSKHAKNPSPPTPLPQGERGKGRMGYLELVDGDTGTGWAWLAVGRFSLAALNPNDSAKRQQLAAELVGKLKLASLRPQMVALVTDPQTDPSARVAAAQALVALRPDSRASALAAALTEPSLPADLRLKLGRAIVDDANQPYLDSLRDVMKLAPSRLQTALAETLAGDATGADALLTTIAAGAASPRLLLAPNVKTKLTALKSEPVDRRVLDLTAKLPPANQVLDKLIADRRNAYGKAAPSLERGQAVFTKHCAACHQLEGKGAVVGPQLDGIGNRGLDRLIEDTLDPNRNVDVAFRTTTLRLVDGRVLSGLLRREEGSQLVLADNQGKEFIVAKEDIEEQQKTPLSLMPANVGEIVPEGEFFDLLGWLLSKRQVAEGRPVP